MIELNIKINLLESNRDMELDTIEELIEFLEVIKENYSNIKISSDEYDQPTSTEHETETEHKYDYYERSILKRW